MTEKKYSSLPSMQSSEIKPNTKLVLKLLQGNKSLLCLEFNEPSKQTFYMLNIFLKISTTKNC